MQGQTTQATEAAEAPSEEALAAATASYDYLLSMALWSLTAEKVGSLDMPMSNAPCADWSPGSRTHTL